MTPYEAAILSKDSYRAPDPKEPNFNFPEAEKLGWKYVTSSDEAGMSKDGYFGVAFKKGDTVVVVHRGTDPERSKNSDFDDAYKIWNNKVPGQYYQANKFVGTIKNKYSSEFNVETTGHSAGGLYSLLTGIAHNIYSTPIDTPGMKGIVKQLFTPEQIANGVAKTNIFLSAPNFVNTCGEHITSVTQLKFHTPVKSLFRSAYAFDYTKDGQHAIANIIAQGFDPETHQPINAVHHDHWPSGFEAGYERFVEYSLKNNPYQGFDVPKNSMTREEIALKYNVDVNRVQEMDPAKIVFVDNFMDHNTYYTILPVQTYFKTSAENIFAQPFSYSKFPYEKEAPKSGFEQESQRTKEKFDEAAGNFNKPHSEWRTKTQQEKTEQAYKEFKESGEGFDKYKSKPDSEGNDKKSREDTDKSNAQTSSHEKTQKAHDEFKKSGEKFDRPPTSTPYTEQKSWWEQTRDYFKSEPPKPEPKPEPFKFYKTYYNPPPIFQFETIKPTGHFIYEPSNLYYGASRMFGSRPQDSHKYYEAKKEAYSAAQSCLQSAFCWETSSDIVNRVIMEKYGSSFFAPPGIESDLKQDVKSAAFGSFTFKPVGSLYSDFKTFSLGSWTHPLREELGYGASHVSPLVFDLNKDGIHLTPYTNGTYFDIDNDGFIERVGWLSSEDGQLALDLNGNGVIDDITELFGDDLISAFSKLSLFDSNVDKVIDQDDEDFEQLLIWQDKNSNGFSEPGELKTLKEMKIKSISLSTKPDDRVIEGNKITETTRFTFENGETSEVADVHYHNDDMDSWYKGDTKQPVAKKSQFATQLGKLRDELLTKLKSAAQDPKSVDTKSDWAAKIIKDTSDEYIIAYQKQSEEEIRQYQEKINKKYKNKKTEVIKNHQELKQEYLKSINEKLQSAIKVATLKLHEEVSASLKAERDTLASKYIQEQNSLIEKLLAESNAALKSMNGADNTRLANQYNRVANGQQLYDAAIKAAFSANKIAVEVKHEKQAKEIKEKLGLEFARESALLKEKYRSEFESKSDEIAEKLKNELQASALENEYNTDHNFAFNQKHLKILLAEMLTKFSSLNKEKQARLEEVIKQEANSVYDYFLNEIVANENAAENKDEDEKVEDHYWWDSNHYDQKQNVSEGNNTLGSSIKIDPDTLFLPMMRGYGKLPALHIAMSDNPSLKEEVIKFAALLPTEFHKMYDYLIEILYKWAGIENIPEDARSPAGGANIEARKVVFVERVTGQEFKQLGAANFVGQHASTSLQKVWDMALIRMSKSLLVQGPLISIFPQAEYSFLEDDVKLNSSLEDILSSAKKIADENKLGYDFWVQLGYILAQSTKELKATIQVIKGKLSQLAGEEIMIDLDMFQLVGNDKDNTIKGTSGSDYIKGLAGNDKLYGKGGADFLDGGDGNDELYGEEGTDRMHGGAGNDKMSGGTDRDFMYGDEGNDNILGEEGDDHIEGGEGADTMDGGTGTDTLSYGKSEKGVKVNLLTGEATGGDAEGDKFINFENLGGSDADDVLYGDDKDNHINGESGDDEIHGGKGDDDLFGAKGKDYLYGEDGDDHLSGFEGEDHMDGGEGKDTASYHHPYSLYGVKVNLETGKGFGGYAQGDTYKNIENVIGSKFGDKITGDNNDNVIQGMEGDDIIDGKGGDDTIYGGVGDNTIDGGEDDDTIILSRGSDIVDGGNGTDTVSYRYLPEGIKVNLTQGTCKKNILHNDFLSGIENVEGTNSNDEIIGDYKDNVLVGLDGDDEMYGEAGNDRIMPGKGNDKVFGGKGNDHIIAGEGKQTFDGGEGDDTVDYSQEKKEGITVNLNTGTLKGGMAADDKIKSIENIVATNFNDALVGDAENNYLSGLDGDDVIDGGEGSDILSGGTGKNILKGGNGNDQFIVGEGFNTIDGGYGSDTLNYKKAKAGIEIVLDTKVAKIEGIETDTFEDIDGVMGSDFNDTIIGDDNSNRLFGGDGDDFIDGGGWSDIISGGKGNNTLHGGTGNDEFILSEGSNNVDGGKGIDALSYLDYFKREYNEVMLKDEGMLALHKLLPSYPGQQYVYQAFQMCTGLTIDLAKGIVEKPEGRVDKFVNMENVIGTHYNDTIIGDNGNNLLDGSDGYDKIYGGKGNDTLKSGRGISHLYGEDGDDKFDIQIGIANIFGGDGVDMVDFMYYPTSIVANLARGHIIYGGDNYSELKDIEKIRTTKFSDIIYDSNNDNIIGTGHGDDVIYISDGNDSVNAGAGDDRIYLQGRGEKRIWGEFGRDAFVITRGFSSAENTSTVIVDFETEIPRDLIDIRSFTNIKSLQQLQIEQYVNEGNKFAIIKIEEGKEIALYNVDISTVHESSFVFFQTEDEVYAQLSANNYISQGRQGCTGLHNSIGAYTDDSTGTVANNNPALTEQDFIN
jgi:Ca2+-binding RTX toxin-like protein